uniref:Uncharacterized protein n=1 Tax=Rhizophora mucronata TaxID=61149 RepID=A0A2P2MZ16_RHIMU
MYGEGKKKLVVTGNSKVEMLTTYATGFKESLMSLQV